MQELLLFGLFVLAIYYLYRKLIKNRGCNCSSKGDCAAPIIPSIKKSRDDEEF